MALKFPGIFGRKARQQAAPAQPEELNLQRQTAAKALQSGNFAEAIERYDGLLARNADDAEAHYKRANALNMLGRFDEAVAGYDRAIALKPDYANAYCNRGTALERLGRWEKALASYERTLVLNPTDALANYNRGSVLRELKRLEDALASYDGAIALRSDYVEAHFNRGNVLQELRRYQSALASYDRALELKPAFSEAFHARGVSLMTLRRFPEALASFNRAIALNPEFAEAFVNRGNLLHDHLLQTEPAVSDYNRAIQLAPDLPEVCGSLGTALSRLKRYDEAIRSFDRALAINPDQKYLVGLRQHVKMHICDWSDFAPQLQRIEAGLAAEQAVAVPLPVLALFDSPRLHQLAARVWVREECPADESLGAIETRPSADRVRIGYFSADFRTHPVAQLATGVFEAHDRSKFEVTAFAFGSDVDDAPRIRLRRAFERFIDVNTRSDGEVALLARELGIDIAIDLGGYTEQSRAKVFAQRTAPLQVGYLGYPGTSGAPYMDYLIADRTLIPEGDEQYYSEQIIRLPGSYQPNDCTRTISEQTFTRAQLGLPEQGFVFCCFNRGFKILPDTFDDWMRILKTVEGSVLWLSESDQTALSNLRQQAERRGVQRERLIQATNMPSMGDHLARLRAADLFLDTLPFNAHTTASDALWAGLPVLTCAGHALPGRVAASLLNALDMPELITTTREEYRALAVRLALNPPELQQLRGKLARNRLTTPLFDTVRFTRHLEAAYTWIHERRQSGLAPAHVLLGAGA